MTAAPSFPSLLTLCFQGREGLPWLAHLAQPWSPPAGCCAPALAGPSAGSSCQAEGPEPETSIQPRWNWGSVSKDTQGLWPTGQAWPFLFSPETWAPLLDEKPLRRRFRSGGWVTAKPHLGTPPGKVGAQETGQEASGHTP